MFLAIAHLLVYVSIQAEMSKLYVYVVMINMINERHYHACFN